MHGVTVELPNGGGMKAIPGHRFLTDEWKDGAQFREIELDIDWIQPRIELRWFGLCQDFQETFWNELEPPFLTAFRYQQIKRALRIISNNRNSINTLNTCRITRWFICITRWFD